MIDSIIACSSTRAGAQMTPKSGHRPITRRVEHQDPYASRCIRQISGYSGHNIATPATMAHGNRPSPLATKDRKLPMPTQDDTTLAGEPSPITLRINGQPRTLRIGPEVTLLVALREHLDLTGSKKGCDLGQCGACTVLMDGKRVNACLVLAVACPRQARSPRSRAWPAMASCTRCKRPSSTTTPSSAATARQARSCRPWPCIDEGRANDETEIRQHMSGNLCRCGAYANIIAAIQPGRRAGRNHASPDSPLPRPDALYHERPARSRPARRCRVHCRRHRHDPAHEGMGPHTAALIDLIPCWALVSMPPPMACASTPAPRMEEAASYAPLADGARA